MGRKPDPDRKPQLLQEIGEYLAEYGLGDFSLRPLAEHLGVSTYTLVYHFGSKENVIYEAISHLDKQQHDMITGWIAEEGGSLADVLDRFWEWFVQPENRKKIRLFHEASLARGEGKSPTPEQQQQLVASWLRFAEDGQLRYGYDPQEARRRATMISATITGLQIDCIATNDVERTTDAHQRFTTALREEMRR